MKTWVQIYRAHLNSDVIVTIYNPMLETGCLDRVNTQKLEAQLAWGIQGEPTRDFIPNKGEDTYR